MILTFFLSGIGSATFALAAIFFLKFWWVSQDRLFLFLCAACGLLTLERIAGLVTYLVLPTDAETLDLTRSWIYLFRLLAFLLIIYSIVEKNWSAQRR